MIYLNIDFNFIIKPVLAFMTELVKQYHGIDLDEETINELFNVFFSLKLK